MDVIVSPPLNVLLLFVLLMYVFLIVVELQTWLRDVCVLVKLNAYQTTVQLMVIVKVHAMKLNLLVLPIMMAVTVSRLLIVDLQFVLTQFVSQLAEV